jgi:hypothetical protein
MPVPRVHDATRALKSQEPLRGQRGSNHRPPVFQTVQGIHVYLAIRPERPMQQQVRFSPSRGPDDEVVDHA